MKMKKYDKIKRLGHRSNDGILNGGELWILEKLDGNNFRVQLKDGELLMGTRRTKFAEQGDPLPASEIGGQFDAVSSYVEENVDPEDLKNLEETLETEIVLFGENMVKHTLDYNWEEAPQWLLFDVYYVESGKYAGFDIVKEIADDLGIAHVPEVDQVSTEEFKERFDPDDPDSIVPESEYRDGKAEGVVLRNRDNKIKAKVLTEEFKEKHDASSGDGAEHGKEHLHDDTMELVNTYATNGRIRKHIKKLTVDEGKDLEMPLMEELPMRVVEDIFEEEYEEMVRMNKSINFKKFRSAVADKCVTMLKSELRKQSMEEE